MFGGICGLCADLVAIFGVLVIVGFEGPGFVRAQLVRWTTRRSSNDFFIEMVSEVAPEGTRVDTDGLVDKVPTERIPVTEWLRGDLNVNAPVTEWLRGDLNPQPQPQTQAQPQAQAEPEPEAEPELVHVRTRGEASAAAPARKKARVRPSVRKKRR